MSDEKIDRILDAQARQDVKLTQICEKVDKCLTGLYGSAEHPENGLNIKVDRLEQVERKRSKVIWAIVAGMVTLLGKTLWAAIGW